MGRDRERTQFKTMRCFRKLFSYIRGSISGDMKKWHASEGQMFLKKIGLCNGHTLIDFGSRTGNYAIPAAIVVGTHGVIYAIDKNHRVLEKLQRKADSLGLTNIHTVLNSGNVNIEMGNNSADFVMTYDVLHMLELNMRQKLYKEIYRVLRNSGIFSVHPKHTIADIPARHFKRTQTDDVKKEIMKEGFVFDREIKGILSHGNCLDNGCVFNFRKNNTNTD